MARLSSFSQQNAPIMEGKQMVSFAPECLAYIKEHGDFPEFRDGRGDYLHMQFVLKNGAKTASWKEDRMERNPKFMDNIKLYFDGKYDGDGFQMRLTYKALQARDKRYKEMTMEQILGDLIDQKEFPVWFYRYESKGRYYLQIAWNAQQYKNLTQKKTAKKPVSAPTAVEEEELPMDF